MPNNNGRVQTVYLPTGNPDTTNVTTLYKPGELGAKFDSQLGGTVGTALYQRVQCDSGATASTPTGIVAANQVAFWKDKTQYLVTNDQRQAEAGSTANGWRNQAAGVFRVAATAGNYVDIIQRGNAVPVKCSATPLIGDSAVPNSGANADVTNVTAGTAATYQIVGIFTNAGNGTNANVDLNLPEVD